MKAKDITVGNEYAYQNNTWSQGRRVKVLAKDTKPASYRSQAKSGWLIEFLDEPGSGQRYQPKGSTTQATSRQITADWEAFDRQAKIEREEQAARLAALEAERAKQQAAVKELRKILADSGYSDEWTKAYIHSSMSFNASALLDIIQNTITARGTK